MASYPDYWDLAPYDTSQSYSPFDEISMAQSLGQPGFNSTEVAKVDTFPSELPEMNPTAFYTLNDWEPWPVPTNHGPAPMALNPSRTSSSINLSAFLANESPPSASYGRAGLPPLRSQSLYIISFNLAIYPSQSNVECYTSII